MATSAQSVSVLHFSLSWLGEFLKEELAPYPGRAALVARMVIAATLAMLICMVFRIPYAFQAPIYALFVSRESSQAALKSAGSILLLTGMGGAYLLTSAWFVISIPTLHLLWVVASFFLGFYAISALNNFAVSSNFAIMICIGVPLWDRHVSAETNVEDTLWLCLGAATGVVITVAVEMLFSQIKPGEDIVEGVAERLAAVQRLLVCLAEHRPADRHAQADVARLTVVGMSALRRALRRSAYAPSYAEKMGAVIAFTGKLVDLTASLTLPTELPERNRQGIRRLAENVAGIRADLLAGGTSYYLDESLSALGNAAQTIPVLREMEKTVRLIKEVLVGSESLSVPGRHPPSDDPLPTFLVRDAFANIEHVEFALKGCLTTSLCYFIYSGADWPGISTAVTTCFLTALSTIGSSRQKQLLRICGAVVGGFLFGMGSQIFILPYVDSIAGFAILFILVTALASWVMTSSARLSYAGVQIAIAFCLIHLNSFAIDPSLSIARDRVVGILLGLVMMWFVFDQLWGAPAVAETKKEFISVLRLLAQFAREPDSADARTATGRSYSLRETISRGFDNVRASADGVLFEFGASRQRDLVWRGKIREWQLHLRLLFLTEIALWKYRAQLPGFELPDAIRAAQREFDDQSATMLDAFANTLEGKAADQNAGLRERFERLEHAVNNYRLKQPQKSLEPQIETFLQFSTRLKDLAILLDRQIHLVEGAAVEAG